MFNFDYLEDLTKFNEGTIEAHSSVFSSKEIISLNGEWNIECFLNPNEVPSNLLYGDKLSSSNTIEVPSNLQLKGFDTPQYTNTQYPWDAKEALLPPQIPKKDNLVAIYQKEIEIEKNQLDEKIIHLVFEGVETSLALYINQQYVGYKEDSFTTSTFEINKYLKPGNNLISCIVTHYCSGSWLEDQDFWRLSGIFRPVNIELFPKNFIQDIFVEPKVNDNLDTGSLDINLKLNKNTSGKLSFYISNPEIKEDKINVNDFTLKALTKGNLFKEIEINSEKEISFSKEIDNIVLYNNEFPNLYTIFVELEANSSKFTIALEIGFRKVEIIKNVLYVNKKRFVFNGVNRHEFSSSKGKAIGFDEIKKDLLIMKDNNINSIRTSHYPNQNIFYSLCNRMGFYVIDETNLETHGTTINPLGKLDYTIAIPYNRNEWKACTLDRANSMAQRDKNHPSIIMFSCGNESSDGSVLIELSNLLKTFGNRVIHYENVLFDSEYESISDVESQMYTKPKDVEDFLINHPKKPFMLCEYCHAMGNSCGNLKEYTDLARKYKNYQGGFIWDFIDQSLDFGEDCKVYGGLKGKFPTDADFCCNGLLFSSYEKSFKLQEIKKLFSPIVFETKENAIKIINEYNYRNLNEFSFQIEVIKEGVYINDFKIDDYLNTSKLNIIDNDSFTIDLNPGKELILTINNQEAKDLIINIYAYDRNNKLVNDHSFSYLNNYDNNPYFNDISKPINLIWGKDNVGVATNNVNFLIKYLFTKVNGILINEKNILEKPISLEFWRAPNNNDKANDNSLRWAANKARSLYQKFAGYDQKPNQATFDVLCYDEKYKVKYKFDSNSKMQIDITRLGDFTNTDMPCFGISFALNNEYNKIRYFGNIKGEAYVDRKESALLGIREEYIEDQYVKYVDPQECGNKTDLRYVELLNKDNHGLRITTSTIFEGSFLPYSSHEIEEAKHFEDLTTHEYNFIRILHGQSGIAGDDTWGAPIHDKYLYHGIKDTWSITIEII